MRCATSFSKNPVTNSSSKTFSCRNILSVILLVSIYMVIRPKAYNLLTISRKTLEVSPFVWSILKRLLVLLSTLSRRIRSAPDAFISRWSARTTITSLCYKLDSTCTVFELNKSVKAAIACLNCTGITSFFFCFAARRYSSLHSSTALLAIYRLRLMSPLYMDTLREMKSSPFWSIILSMFKRRSRRIFWIC